MTLLTYRVKVLNSAGRSAGESAVAAYAAAGSAPASVASLQARAAEDGAILEWHSGIMPAGDTAQMLNLKRVDLSPVASPADSKEKRSKPTAGPASGRIKSVKPRKAVEDASPDVHLKADETVAKPESQMAGTVDTTVAMGDTYSYIAQRVRTVKVGGHQLEIKSAPSPPATVVMLDTFPPKPPTGLATISGLGVPNPSSSAAMGAYVDLSWEPNGETDLAGYRVYRQLARPDGSPQGPLARLTAFPIAAPAYRDVAVRAGQGYIYSVTAVDAAGNESAPSAKALEVINPDFR